MDTNKCLNIFINVRNMCARCVQVVLNMCARCAQYVCKMCARCAQDVRKLCARIVQDLLNMCARCLQDVCNVEIPSTHQASAPATKAPLPSSPAEPSSPAPGSLSFRQLEARVDTLFSITNSASDVVVQYSILKLSYFFSIFESSNREFNIIYSRWFKIDQPISVPEV